MSEGALPAPRTRDRIALLDVLRGFALLGILVMNVQSFSMPSAAYVNPTAYGHLAGADYLVWLLGYLLCDLKFISLFSMLFGAGVLVSTGSWGEGPERPRAFHLRRMGALLCFGLLHAYLVWYGDILVTYALCGLLVYRFRRWEPARKLRVAGGLLLVPTALALLTWVLATRVPSLRIAPTLEAAWGSSGAGVARELAAFRGGPRQWFAVNARLAFEQELGELFVLYLWRATGCMLLGMGLLEVGALAGRWAPSRYARLAAWGFGLGLPVVGLAVLLHERSGWRALSSFFLYGQLNALGSVGVALGWLGLTGWVVARGALPRATEAVAALGRVAFTAYLTQSVVGSLVFRGHGLGYFGSVSRTGQLGFVLALWLSQLALAQAWQRVALFGPLEWLWRCASYARWMPLWRKPAAS